jgi:diguanylate cyclase (GGDEF)-like protein/PAS domain S-box-containing protein
MPSKSYMLPAGFIDLLFDAVCVVGKDGRYVYVSAAFERIFGYAPDEVIGTPMLDLVLPEDRGKTIQTASQVMAGSPIPHFENRYVRKDGQIVHVQWSARWSEDHQTRIGIAHDISSRKQSEARQSVLYAISEAALHTDDLLELFARIHEIIDTLLPTNSFTVLLHGENEGQGAVPYHVEAGVSADFPLRSVAEWLGAEAMQTGQPLLITPGKPAALAVVGPNLPAEAHIVSWLAIPLSTPKGIVGSLVLTGPGHSRPYVETDKELLHFVSNQLAIAVERKQLYRRLQHLALYDDLTGLANRRLLLDHFGRALARAKREQTRLSVVYLDLDKFKQVNDTMGHAVGDLLLRAVAGRLKLITRESDTVARIGGDEFVVLMENIGAPENVDTVVEKIRSALSQPLEVEGSSLAIRPSLGVALYPEHGDQVELLMKHADAAMYREKNGSISP